MRVETMEWYSDYIDNRLQTGLNLEDLFPNREGQTEKGRNILLQYLGLSFVKSLPWFVIETHGSK